MYLRWERSAAVRSMPAAAAVAYLNRRLICTPPTGVPWWWWMRRSVAWMRCVHTRTRQTTYTNDYIQSRAAGVKWRHQKDVSDLNDAVRLRARALPDCADTTTSNLTSELFSNGLVQLTLLYITIYCKCTPALFLYSVYNELWHLLYQSAANVKRCARDALGGWQKDAESKIS